MDLRHISISGITKPLTKIRQGPTDIIFIPSQNNCLLIKRENARTDFPQTRRQGVQAFSKCKNTKISIYKHLKRKNMKEKIITSVKTCMRIKRVKPTRNKCIRKLRRLRIWLGVEPLPIAPDDALEVLTQQKITGLKTTAFQGRVPRSLPGW